MAPPDGPGARSKAAALVRLGHPFPSLLDGAITGLLAIVAGAPAGRAVVLGIAMVALQVSIGSLNDLVDVDRDRGRKLGKPLPTGLVGQVSARAIVVVGVVAGLGLSLALGPAVLVVALAGTATGYAYDLRLKGTAWGWLPFAVGIPLLPVYAWVGGVGRLPTAFLILLPLAVAAGAAVALLNGLVDVDRDRAAGLETPVVRLGVSRARRAAVALVTVVVAGVVASLAWIGAEPVAWLAVILGAGLGAIGLVLAGSDRAVTRERGWEAAAVGLAVLAAGWAIGFARAGLL